jgi:hypothetical protein
MKLIIGCPIYKRDWILPHWIRCLLSQSLDISDIGFVFEVSPGDYETVNSLNVWKKLDSRIKIFEINERSDIPHFEHSPDTRQWTISKYHNMVSLRNSILNRVREIQPEFYLSLDSDILLTNPNTLEMLIAHIKSGADAVSPLMFMTPVGINFPSVMTWRDEIGGKAYRQERYPLGSYFQSDVIMAAKMMSKDVYNNVDYEVHTQGEDLGWSKNAGLKGFKLYSASYLYANHIMGPKMYEDFLRNGDNRYSLLLDNYIKV